jgi:CheY-like chemotaxis protein
MRMALTYAGFVARVAANREQIVAAFRQPPLPDLVLLDVTLPDTNGFEVLATMRRHPILGEVPVIMVTGTATREAVLKGLLGEANGYITKPFQIAVLVKAVKAVLGIEASEQEAVSGNIPGVAEPARPVTVAIPEAPSSEPAAEPEEYPASPGSLLARLKLEAQAKLLELEKQKRDDSNDQMIPRVSGAVERAYRYMTEFAAQLNLVKPAYANEYTIVGVPTFDDLKWEDIRINLRMRELSLRSQITRAFEQITLNFKLSANKKLSVAREAPADEKLKHLLHEAKIAFTTERERNERGSVICTTFIIPCEVKGSLLLAGDFDSGKLLLKTRNIGHFGATEHVLTPEAITEEGLNELAHFILGESSRIGALLLKSA